MREAWRKIVPELISSVTTGANLQVRTKCESAGGDKVGETAPKIDLCCFNVHFLQRVSSQKLTILVCQGIKHICSLLCGLLEEWIIEFLDYRGDFFFCSRPNV